MARQFTTFLSILFLCVMSVSGCGTKNDETIGFSYNAKMVFEEREDGWVYISSYEHYVDLDEFFYDYDAYNFKYQYVEGYDLLILDEEGNIVDKATTILPYMAVKPEAGNDSRAIGDYISNNKVEDFITEEQIRDLTFEYFDKSDVLRMFNNTIAAEFQTEGKYKNLQMFHMLQSDVVNNYKWQAAYYNCYGNIVVFKIELIYVDNSNNEIHLSDLVDSKTATAEQKEIYDKYKEVERTVLAKNSFSDGKVKSNLELGGVKFGQLNALLDRYERGEY
ncbi:MAG: hypothetical protein FWG40_11640 [Peptococcaceae bacterium]|nr:hypothetical protein [Peptococcaceae bacterium]